MRIICDTNALLFDALQPDRLTDKARQALDDGEQDRSLACSDISLWEIAMLITRQRIIVDAEPRVFLEAILAARHIQVLPISPRIAALSQSGLFPHGDPADRIIAATAMHYHAPLITSDGKLRQLEQFATIW